AHPGAVPALRRLAPQLCAVAVITGRPAEVAARYAGVAGVTGLERLTVLGHYGRERWDARTQHVSAPGPPPGLAAVRDRLPALLADLGVPEGTAVEDKGSAVAVHVRRSADPEAALAMLRGPLAALAARHGLAVEPGRMVLELRPPGVDKGAALRGLVRECGAACVLYAGDDLGDLAAYDAVDALRAERTAGVKVFSRSAEVTALAERADLVVDGPAGVVALLDGLADAL
ncbi:MAG: trehalose-phosphatase, partial [Streptomycetales bacterium]